MDEEPGLLGAPWAGAVADKDELELSVGVTGTGDFSILTFCPICI